MTIAGHLGPAVRASTMGRHLLCDISRNAATSIYFFGEVKDGKLLKRKIAEEVRQQPIL